VIADGAHVREQAVKRDYCRNPRKEGEESEERHPAGGGQDPIFRDRPQDPPQDIFPSAGRDLLWSRCLPPAARFSGAGKITGTRIIRLAHMRAPVVTPFAVHHG